MEQEGAPATCAKRGLHRSGLRLSAAHTAPPAGQQPACGQGEGSQGAVTSPI